MTAGTVRFRVTPPRPYSLPLTASRYTRFPEVVDRFDGVRYRRLLAGGRRAVLLTVSQRGAPERAVLDVTLEGPGAREPAARAASLRVVEGALGAASKVRPFYRACGEDRLLSGAIRDFRGLRIAGWPSLWEALVTAILCQQVNLRFAYDIRRELALALGSRARIAGAVHVAFPTPHSVGALTPRALRRFRLSGGKARAILGLARAFESGALEEGVIAALPDEAAIEALVAFPGVGRWTAEVALLRGLGRADVFPAGDLGVVKYMAVGLLGRSARVAEAEMRDFARRWEPYRGLALVYAYAELSRRHEASRRARELSPRPPARPPDRRARRRPPEIARSQKS